jgi:RNA polymerase sigma-70 factor (ECF subfamily)
VRIALAYLVRQGYRLDSLGADDYESIAEDLAQDSLVIIMRQLDTFRGDSRFTTWAYRIVINLVAEHFRRRAWHQRLDRFPAEGTDRAGGEEGPSQVAESREVWAVIEHVINHELTARQRHALVGRIFEEKPLVVLAEELATDKDNVYKLIHDARKRLKRALAAEGLADLEVRSPARVSEPTGDPRANDRGG